MNRKLRNSVTYVRYIFKSFYEEDCIVKITVNLRRLMPDEDTASSTPQPACKTGIAIFLLFVAIFSASFMKSVTTKGEAGKRVCMPNSSTFCISLEIGMLRILKKIMLTDQLSWIRLSKRGSGIENSVSVL